MKRLLLFVALLGALPVGAEIVKSGTSCQTGICLYWWPKPPAINGWHQEIGPSQHYGANTLAPDGSAFKDAETVMYAKASYKPRASETKSIDALIAKDKHNFTKNVPDIIISEINPLITGDGQKLRSLTFFPASEGNWEQTAYGEEDDFFLIFTISSRTKSAYERSLPAFEEMIHAYKKKL